MTTERRQFWLWAGAAMACGVLLRLWFIRHMALIDGDSLMYGDIAKNWLQHGIYGFTESGIRRGSIQIRSTLIRLPGYPLFLATCFRIFGIEHYTAVLYVQAAADLLTCWLASALAGLLFGSRAAIAVLWLSALCPFTAAYVAAPLTETLVLTSIALVFYSFARWQRESCGYNRWLWVSAASLAWSILLRPEQTLFAAAVLSAMLWGSLAHRASNSRPLQSVLPVLAAALFVLVPLVPWTIRNEHTFHVFQPLAPRYANDPDELPPTGFARWYRTWAIDFDATEKVYWNYSGESINIADVSDRAFDAGSPAQTAEMHQRAASLLARYNATMGGRTAVSPIIDACFAELAAERIREHPVRYYLGLPIARVLDMTLRPRIETLPLPLDWWAWSKHRVQTAFAASYAALNLVYLVLGVAGFVAWKRRGWQSVDSSPAHGFRELALAMAASVLLRAALLLTIDNSEPRYTLEFFPVLFVCVGALFAAHRQVEPVREPGKG